jgi:NAD(P)-dependent dehydrogenase (short-subunit alcohol dehydrogenase family)
VIRGEHARGPCPTGRAGPRDRSGGARGHRLCRAFLASPAGSWITGKILEVDGGIVASNWPYVIPSGFEESG